VLRFDRPFNETSLVEAFRTPTRGLVRAKGLVAVAGWPDDRGVLQVVGARITLTRLALAVPEAGSAIVVIGTTAEFDADALTARLAAACGGFRLRA
jgi:G3E family GTPase